MNTKSSSSRVRFFALILVTFLCAVQIRGNAQDSPAPAPVQIELVLPISLLKGQSLTMCGQKLSQIFENWSSPIQIEEDIDIRSSNGIHLHSEHGSATIRRDKKQGVYTIILSLPNQTEGQKPPTAELILPRSLVKGQVFDLCVEKLIHISDDESIFLQAEGKVTVSWMKGVQLHSNHGRVSFRRDKKQGVFTITVSPSNPAK